MKLFIHILFSAFLFGQSIHQLQMDAQGSKVLSGLDVFINDHLEMVKGKRIGLVTNHTGIDRVGKNNYEILLQLEEIDLKVIFAPEHGFFGNVSAGQKVDDLKENDLPTIYSLYGDTKKPTSAMMAGLDVIIYDIQDVGARFYTYISTLGLVMEAAGGANIPIIVLDRPNPLGGEVVAGPLMYQKFMSFVGMYPIPIQYGLTPGELAKMIVGEKWIDPTPELSIIKMHGWKRNMLISGTGMMWVQPSPNITDMETAIRYPGLCLLEGTNVSEGRGTDHPFKYIGAPWIDPNMLIDTLNQKDLTGVSFEPVSFTPRSKKGRAINPKYENVECHGIEINVTDRFTYKPVDTGIEIIRTIQQLYLDQFEWNDFIYKLWGNDKILEFDRSDSSFKKLSKKYYLYD